MYSKHAPRFGLHCSLLVLLFVATERRILTLLVEIKAELKEVKRMTQSNSHHISTLHASNIDLDDLPDDVNLPITSVAKLVEFDERLKTDSNLEKRLVNYIPFSHMHNCFCLNVSIKSFN